MSLFPYLRTGVIACASLAALLPPSVSMGQPTASTDLYDLTVILDRALESNPEIQARQAAVEASQARLAGSSRPLNNPELELGAEQAESDTYTLGINQTLDWHDKQGAQQQVAQARLVAAQKALQALKQTKAAEMLDAIGSIATQERINRLAQRRRDTLARFARLAEQRHAAGDIPQAELELARLSLAEANMQLAKSGVELIRASSAFFALSGQQLPDNIHLPVKLTYPRMSNKDDETTARNHPGVLSALALAQVARRQIHAENQTRKADPTLGLAAGREGQGNLIGLTFSIPLQVRNDFRSNVDTARAEALQADQEAQQVFRNIMAKLRAARQRYQLISSAWSMWTAQGLTSLQQRIALLESAWQAGEMNTTDYLLQIQQSLETRIAASELQGERWSAWVEWLSASTNLNGWLYGRSKEQ